ncbi:MAG: hypothetical protein HY650_07070 [Acidobacteria bacterium]|nr:hypothetical protein [Acidobacteriota bacterium]
MIVLAVAALMVPARAARAGGTLYWEIPSQAGLLKGESRGVAFGPHGEILLAPRMDLIFDTEQPFVWCMEADAQGNLFVGTGHEGKLFRIPSRGTVEMLMDAAELDVTALAIDAKGSVYAATSPGGKVYRIDIEGRVAVFFDPEDAYIWSMIHREGELYVATGSKGRVYRVNAKGEGSVLCETNESNVVSMVFDRRGGLVVGTDPSGLVLRIDKAGKAFALFDSPLKEIHGLQSATDGSVLALGISESSTAGSSLPPLSTSTGYRATGPTAVASGPGVSVTITNVEPALTTLGSESSSLTFSSAIYRIAPSGGVESLWRSSEATVFCLALDLPGQVWAGTNDKGRIYRISSRGDVTVAGQSSEGQISSLVGGNVLFLATSNLGKVYRLGSEPAESGEYDAPVLDARFVSQWGTAGWRARTAQVELRTRSGNTESPDSTWSDWSPPIAQGARILSPPGRFLQYRLYLRPAPGAREAAVEGIRIAYVPENIKPVVTSFEALQPSIALQEVPQQPPDPGILTAGLDPALFGFAVNTPPRKVFQRGARSLQWSASDPNGDTLIYQLSYRSVTEERWQVLARNITGNWFTVDADALPDGRYFFKLTASDAPGNPPGREAWGERISELIEVDGTPPVIRAEEPVITGRQVRIPYQVEDLTGNIFRAEFSIDGSAWQSIFPEDGIADSRQERFLVQAEFDSPGEHSVALRVYDMNTNIGSYRTSVRIP